MKANEKEHNTLNMQVNSNIVRKKKFHFIQKH